MLKNASAATTRSATSVRVRFDRARHLLAPAQVITSPETLIEYRIERLLGEGGFGQVYLATRLGRSPVVPEIVCIKVSARIDGWLREAYFGQLLDGHPRAIRVYDAFPLTSPEGRVLYCLTLEYAPHGDLTPMNVFVCDGPSLKLGDFGIVRQQSDRGGIAVRTMNALTAPSDILAGAVPKWQARDDVYQVGQLLGMLVKGDASARLRTGEVRHLACSDHLKEIVYRCIGERRKRYESADEMIDALRNPPPALKPGVLRTLKGVHL